MALVRYEPWKLMARLHDDINRSIKSWLSVALGALIAQGVFAQERQVPDTYTAVTTNMTPADVTLKADVLEWSDESARTAVIDALAAEDPSAALTELPTVGVVWREGSAVGHALKYAHRTMTSDGAERVVLVTDKPVGATSFNQWSAGDAAAEELGYSVIELIPGGDGGGTGTMSLAAEVVIDAETNTLSLARAEGDPALLSEVKLEPKPYWVNDGD